MQERIRVRQRRRGRQVIAGAGLAGPLRQRPQHRRRGPRLQRPGQRHLHHQPRRDLPRPPGRRPGQRLVQHRRAGHAAHQPQPRPLSHRPRLRRHPRRRQLGGGPRRDRGGRARQRPAHHDPPARPRPLQQVPRRVPPDRRHRHHLCQARRRVPPPPLTARIAPRAPQPPHAGPPAPGRRDEAPGSRQRRSRMHRRAPRERRAETADASAYAPVCPVTRPAWCRRGTRAPGQARHPGHAGCGDAP